MALNPTTGLPETPEEEQARLQGQFAPYQSPVVPLALGSTVPTPAPPPLAREPLLATALPPPPEPLGGPVAPENRASFTEPAALPPPPIVTPKPTGGGGGGAPNERQLRGDLARIQGQQAQVAEQRGDLGVARAGIEQQIADQGVVAAQEAENRRAALEQATEAEIAKRQGTLDAETQKYKAMGFRDFWSTATIAGKEGTTTGARVLGAISMALGAAGASLTHGPNYAMEIIDKSIDRDYQMQRDTILKQKDVVTEARFGVEGARLAKADKLLALENWRKSAYEMAGAQAKAMLAKQNVPEAEADKHALVVQTQAKALESKMALDKGIADVADTRAATDLKRAEAARLRMAAAKEKEPKPLTEFQSKSADIAGRLLQEDKVIEKAGPISEEGLRRLRKQAAAEDYLAANPGKRAALIASGELKTPEQLLNDKDRLAYGARKRFAQWMLRGDSGNAIGLSEYLNFDQQMFNQIGDKGPDLEAKRQSRKMGIEGKLVGAGTAAPGVQTRAAVTAAPSVSRPRQIRTKDGRMATLGDDGRYYPDGP